MVKNRAASPEIRVETFYTLQQMPTALVPAAPEVFRASPFKTSVLTSNTNNPEPYPNVAHQLLVKFADHPSSREIE